MIQDGRKQSESKLDLLAVGVLQRRLGAPRRSLLAGAVG
jgi:hypothetical protein